MRRLTKLFITLFVILLSLTSVTGAQAETERETTVHTVVWGDTLFKISLRYDVSMAAIMQTNGIRNPDRIYAGQQLVIPKGVVSDDDDSGDETGEPVWHVVQRGEYLSMISQKYGVPMSVLIQLNNLSNPSLIYPGQRLKISNGGTPGSGPVGDPPSDPGSGTTGKLIVVDLSEQRTYAYQDGVLLRSFVVSTGLPATPTVTGEFAIYLKYESQWMRGPGYSLPGVPWVMYFYSGYGLHGTYWHNNFGQPMSHGCVNMVTSDAEWLWHWAPIGTRVKVQP